MEEVKNSKPGKKSRLLKTVRYTVATVSAIIMLLIIYFLFTFYNLTPDRLYTNNYISYKLSANANEDSSDVSTIETAYTEKKYAEVKNIADDSTLTTGELFLVGLSYLETGDASKAISDFQVVIAEAAKEKSTLLKEDAEYYLAMARLKNRDYDQAIELMIKIHDNTAHAYHEKITPRLIRKIKLLKWR